MKRISNRAHRGAVITRRVRQLYRVNPKSPIPPAKGITHYLNPDGTIPDEFYPVQNGDCVTDVGPPMRQWTRRGDMWEAVCLT